MKLSDIKSNPNNPRIIKDAKFEKLKKSITEFPKMMALRPMVVNDENVILGGNMRFKALKELGYKEVPDEWVKQASDLTDDEARRFIIADNVGFGEHDWDLLANEWDLEQIEDWGVDLPDMDDQIDDLDDGEEIELPQSVQVEPPKEYILIMAEPNSVDWEDLKETLQLRMVRRGGYKKGSGFDAVSLERVLDWSDFKNRINANSSTK